MRIERTVWIALIALILAAGLFVTNIVILQNQSSRSEDQLSEIATAIKDDNRVVISQLGAAQSQLSQLSQPVTDPLQPQEAQITNIIAEATGNQLTHVAEMTANPVTPDPNAATSMPFPPFMQPQIDAATQFAVDRATNPALTATITGCHPGMIFPTSDDALKAELQEQFQHAEIDRAEIYVGVEQNTQDCMNLELQHVRLAIVFNRVEKIDLVQTITSIGDILSQYDSQTFTYIEFQINLQQSGSPPDILLIYNDTFADFHANYEAGLRGLNLLAPNNS